MSSMIKIPVDIQLRSVIIINCNCKTTEQCLSISNFRLVIRNKLLAWVTRKISMLKFAFLLIIDYILMDQWIIFQSCGFKIAA